MKKELVTKIVLIFIALLGFLAVGLIIIKQFI
jgi:hypothetical protein